MPRPQRPAHPSVPALEWVRDLSGRTARVTAVGSGRVLVENHCGLLAYSRECIIIDGGRTRVCLRGTDLQLVAMDSAAVLISGTIVCAEFA